MNKRTKRLLNKALTLTVENIKNLTSHYIETAEKEYQLIILQSSSKLKRLETSQKITYQNNLRKQCS